MRSGKFLSKFKKNTQIPKCTKIRPVGALFFHADIRADGRTDMTKLIVTFRSYVTAPQNYPTTLRTALQSVSKRNCDMSQCRFCTEQVAWVESTLTCTAQVPGSDAPPAYRNFWGFSWFVSVPQGKFWCASRPPSFTSFSIHCIFITESLNYAQLELLTASLNWMHMS
jgi:hypothetical protein